MDLKFQLLFYDKLFNTTHQHTTSLPRHSLPSIPSFWPVHISTSQPRISCESPKMDDSPSLVDAHSINDTSFDSELPSSGPVIAIDDSDVNENEDTNLNQTRADLLRLVVRADNRGRTLGSRSISPRARTRASSASKVISLDDGARISNSNTIERDPINNIENIAQRPAGDPVSNHWGPPYIPEVGLFNELSAPEPIDDGSLVVSNLNGHLGAATAVANAWLEDEDHIVAGLRAIGWLPNRAINPHNHNQNDSNLIRRSASVEHIEGSEPITNDTQVEDEITELPEKSSDPESLPPDDVLQTLVEQSEIRLLRRELTFRLSNLNAQLEPLTIPPLPTSSPRSPLTTSTSDSLLCKLKRLPRVVWDQAAEFLRQCRRALGRRWRDENFQPRDENDAGGDEHELYEV